jgi:hypothetical protein
VTNLPRSRGGGAVRTRIGKNYLFGPEPGQPSFSYSVLPEFCQPLIGLKQQLFIL